MRYPMGSDIQDYETVFQTESSPKVIQARLRSPEIDVGTVWNREDLLEGNTAIDKVFAESCSNHDDPTGAPVQTHFPALQQRDNCAVFNYAELGEYCRPQVAHLHHKWNTPAVGKTRRRHRGEKSGRRSYCHVGRFKMTIAERPGRRQI